MFAVVRGINGYGNLRLLRSDGSLVQWLHVSKYPPSVSYDALELGVMALLLAGLFSGARLIEERGFGRAATEPLRILGETAFFYYLLHVHLLEGAAHALGAQGRLGLGATYAAALVTVLALLPACRVYGRYKQSHPESWVRFI